MEGATYLSKLKNLKVKLNLLVTELMAKQAVKHCNISSIYSELYSWDELGNEFEELCEIIENKVNNDSLIDVDRFTVKFIKEDFGYIKDGKKDIIYYFSSDCLSKSPKELIQHIVNMLKEFLSHEYVPMGILEATLIPRVKENMGDLSSSSTYRAIAIGSLLLKLFDWVLLLLECDKTNNRQTSIWISEAVSTTMCKLTLSTVVEYFNNRGTEVFGAACDISSLQCLLMDIPIQRSYGT